MAIFALRIHQRRIDSNSLEKGCNLKGVSSCNNAEVAHLVEHDLAKVGVAGSSPVFRSEKSRLRAGFFWYTRVVELVDTQDLKSCSPQRE